MTVLCHLKAIMEAMLEELMHGTLKAAAELGIEVLGGHTEVTDAVTKPVISATVIGKTRNRKMVCTGGAKWDRMSS